MAFLQLDEPDDFDEEFSEDEDGVFNVSEEDDEERQEVILDAARAFVNTIRRGEKFLRYSDRNLSKLPAEVLCKCSALKSLLIQRNKLSDAEGLENLINVHTLSLATNQFKKFPHQVLVLERLTYLNLSNNLIGFVPASIQELRNLEVLWLNNTGISFLPQELSRLRKLETLGARHNSLRSVPHEFSELTSLRWLTLVGNKITWLPMCFRRLTGLKHLNLSSNRFTILPPAVGCMPSLKYCFFDKNEIRFPDFVVLLRLAALGTIKRLYLTENPIIGRPSLGRFPFLRLSSGWLDWMECGSAWEESLGTSSLDSSVSASSSSYEEAPPIIIEADQIRKALTFLL